eukprot:7145875-Pyramimonas_sp.AAC.1
MPGRCLASISGSSAIMRSSVKRLVIRTCLACLCHSKGMHALGGDSQVHFVRELLGQHQQRHVLHSEIVRGVLPSEAVAVSAPPKRRLAVQSGAQPEHCHASAAREGVRGFIDQV